MMCTPGAQFAHDLTGLLTELETEYRRLLKDPPPLPNGIVPKYVPAHLRQIAYENVRRRRESGSVSSVTQPSESAPSPSPKGATGRSSKGGSTHPSPLSPNAYGKLRKQP